MKSHYRTTVCRVGPCSGHLLCGRSAIVFYAGREQKREAEFVDQIQEKHCPAPSLAWSAVYNRGVRTFEST